MAACINPSESPRRKAHRAGSTIAVMITLSCILHGCADPTDPGIFFPLRAGTTWQYRIERSTTDGARELREIITTRRPNAATDESKAMHETSDGHRKFYASDSAGIWRVASERRDRDTRVVDRERVLMLPSPLHLNAAWQSPSVTVVLESSAPPWETLFRLTAPIAMHYHVEALDATIETPAGKFADCLVIRGVGKHEVDAGQYLGNLTIEISTTQWFAPGVGLVRAERYENTSSALLKSGQLIVELDRWHDD